MRVLLFPTFVWSIVTWVEAFAQTDACGGRVPGFDKFALVFGRAFSNAGSTVSVECVAGNEAT